MKAIINRISPPKWKRHYAEKKVMRLQAAFKRISTRGVEIGTFIDVGSSDGRWSELVMPYYPDADYILIEANPHHADALKDFCEKHPNVSYKTAAASNAPGQVSFDVSNPFGGKAAPESSTNAITVDAIPLDTLTQHADIRKRPFAIKLDTHGHEVPILEGAQETLKESSLVVLETYNFRKGKNALIFDEMVAYMRELGFGVVDISDPMWRNDDRCLWQMDLYFEPLTSAARQSNGFR